MTIPRPAVSRANPRHFQPRHLRAALALGCVLALTGCGGGSAIATFDLTSPSRSSAARMSMRQLIVNEPATTSPLDGDGIVVRPSPETVATVKGAQWSERLPRLFQSRLIQAFENARLVQSVGRPSDRLTADFSLVTEIRHFEIDVASGQAVVEVSAKIVREGSGRIVAGKIFLVRGPGSAADGGAASVALDQVNAEAMRQIVGWTASHI